MKTTFEHVARTTLDENIAIGEYSAIKTTALPGVYNVYNVTINDSDEYAFMFVHETVSNLDNVLPILDIVGIGGVDGGTYGIVNDEDKFSFDEWFNRAADKSQNQTDGYVGYTNHGDGDFLLYTNNEHSVFLLDDEDVYEQALLAETEYIYDDETDYYEYSWPENRIEVTYYVDDDEFERTVPVPAGARKIDTIIKTIAALSVEAHSQDGGFPPSFFYVK